MSSSRCPFLQILLATAYKMTWDKSPEETTSLEKAIEILGTIEERSLAVVKMLGECLQRAGKTEQVRVVFSVFDSPILYCIFCSAPE